MPQVRRIWRRFFFSFTVRPSTRMSPPSIFSRPLMQRSRVLLPVPLGPSSTVTPSWSKETLNSRSTVSSPKRLVMPLTSIIAITFTSNQ